MVNRFAFAPDSFSGNKVPAPFSPARWPAGVALALLAVLLGLLGLRPGPAVALTVAPTGPTEIVSTGHNHTCALTPAGAVECWGQNEFGQAGTHAGPYTQVSAGNVRACALTPAGTVECWGANEFDQAGTHAGPYTQVSAGGYHTCALTPAGALECWGFDNDGQAGIHAGPYTQVSGGNFHTCALTPGGAVECWSTKDQIDTHDGPYSQVSAGANYSCALTPVGAVECWGNNDFGQAGNHAGPYTQVSASGGHTCALTPAGAVECWGDNDLSQAGNHAGPYGPYVPETNITNAPPPLTNGNDPTFEFDSPDTAATFDCRLNGGAWQPCNSPHDYTNLADGAHTFEVRAVSPPGNPDTTPAAHTWTIDTVAPSVVINQAAGQTDPTAAGPIHFTVVFSEAVSGFVGDDVTFSGTAGATTAVVTPISAAVYNVAVSDMTGDGTVIATVAAAVARDAAGNDNTASTSTDNSVTYDTSVTFALYMPIALTVSGGRDRPR